MASMRRNSKTFLPIFCSTSFCSYIRLSAYPIVPASSSPYGIGQKILFATNRPGQQPILFLRPGVVTRGSPLMCRMRSACDSKRSRRWKFPPSESSGFQIETGPVIQKIMRHLIQKLTSGQVSNHVVRTWNTEFRNLSLVSLA